jgi:NRAMP (natural resistance-associated macrophage protein)-like metal ion transporter
MPKKQKPKANSKVNEPANKIEPGMVVEASRGDLGEADISKPKVVDVVQDQQGNVKDVVVEKGALFRKKLEIPADRIQAVEQEPEDEKSPGKVTVDVGEQELEQLKPVGMEELPQEGALDELERRIPTAEGIREMEASKRIETQSARREAAESLKIQQAKQVQQSTTPSKPIQLLRTLGPGFLSGMAGNDATAVTAYAIDGATAGYGHLWLMLLSTPMYQAVQFACAKIGRVTGQGFSQILRKHYGRWVALLISFVLIIANIALLAGDLVAIGSGLELITGLSWVWFVIPVAAILWYLTVLRSFEALKKIFIVLSMAFIAYLVTAIFSHANWAAVLISTFVPQVRLDIANVSAAVALLGATITPYSMVWQMQGEKEQKRPGSTRQQLRAAAIDVASGVIGGNLISYFIIVTTAATLFTHHRSINTAADAASSLQPLLGPFAKYLFAVGLIGAGVIAIPILLASTSYAVAGSFGWPSGLSKKPWQNEGFYLILTFALLVGLIVALLRFSPIQLIFWANVLVGILAPILVVFILSVGNSRKIMGNHRLGLLTNIFLGVTAVVLVAAAVLFFYGLATGQGS